jgi:hypothetical protein
MFAIAEWSVSDVQYKGQDFAWFEGKTEDSLTALIKEALKHRYGEGKFKIEKLYYFKTPNEMANAILELTYGTTEKKETEKSSPHP